MAQPGDLYAEYLSKDNNDTSKPQHFKMSTKQKEFMKSSIKMRQKVTQGGMPTNITALHVPEREKRPTFDAEQNSVILAQLQIPM